MLQLCFTNSWIILSYQNRSIDIITFTMSKWIHSITSHEEDYIVVSPTTNKPQHLNSTSISTIHAFQNAAQLWINNQIIRYRLLLRQRLCLKGRLERTLIENHSTLIDKCTSADDTSEEEPAQHLT